VYISRFDHERGLKGEARHLLEFYQKEYSGRAEPSEAEFKGTRRPGRDSPRRRRLFERGHQLGIRDKRSLQERKRGGSLAG